MSDLTEQEILDCLKTNLRLSAQHCEILAAIPAQGETYEKLREELKLVEGACRQIAHWREDSRWLRLGMQMEVAHQKVWNWVRYKHSRKLFLMFADNLRAALKLADTLETKATGKLGAILPEVLPLHRENRPVQVVRPSGLIVPASMG